MDLRHIAVQMDLLKLYLLMLLALEPLLPIEHQQFAYWKFVPANELVALCR